MKLKFPRLQRVQVDGLVAANSLCAVVTALFTISVIHFCAADYATTSRREFNLDSRSRTTDLKEARRVDNGINDRRRITDTTRRELTRQDRREPSTERRDSREERRDVRDVRRNSREVRQNVARAQDRRDVRRRELRRDGNEIRESRRRQNEQRRSMDQINERRVEDMSVENRRRSLKKGDQHLKNEGRGKFAPMKDGFEM